MILIVSFLFIIFCLLTLFGDAKIKDGKSRLLFFLILALTLILIATFRSAEMPDYKDYEKSFNYTQLTFNRFEPGNLTLINISKWFTDSVLLMLFLYATTSVSLKLYAINKISPFIWGSLCIYVSGFFILHDMIQIRASIASGFLMISIYYAYHRKFWKFLALIALAVLFHYSSAIFIIAWFLGSKKPQRNVYLLLIPAAYIIYFVFSGFAWLADIITFGAINDQVRQYTGVDSDQLNVFNMLQLMRCFFAYLLIWNMKSIKQKYKYGVLLTKIYTLGVCSFVLFADNQGIAFRISEIFLAVEFLAIPALLYMFGRNSFSKGILARCLIIMYAMVNFYYYAIYNEYLLV